MFAAIKLYFAPAVDFVRALPARARSLFAAARDAVVRNRVVILSLVLGVALFGFASRSCAVEARPWDAAVGQFVTTSSLVGYSCQSGAIEALRCNSLVVIARDGFGLISRVGQVVALDPSIDLSGAVAQLNAMTARLVAALPLKQV